MNHESQRECVSWKYNALHDSAKHVIIQNTEHQFSVCLRREKCSLPIKTNQNSIFHNAKSQYQLHTFSNNFFETFFLLQKSLW